MSLDRQLRKFRADAAAIGEAVYRNLPPEERFRLIVQSEAVNNDAEVQRLIDTCPKKTYTQRDAVVMDRVERLAALVTTFCVDLAPPLAQLRLLKSQLFYPDHLKGWEIDGRCQAWFSGYQQGRGEGWRLAGAAGEPLPRWVESKDGDIELVGEDEELPMPLDESPMIGGMVEFTRDMVRRLESRVLEQWAAFTRFCQGDLALEPETVLKSCMAPMLGTVQEALAEIKGIEPDAAKVEEYRDIMRKLWRRLVGLEE
jgi:hypothetical protein